MLDDEITPQQRADIKQNEKRRGWPTVSSIRMKGTREEAFESLGKINDTIELHKGTRADALVEAFALLHEKLTKANKA